MTTTQNTTTTILDECIEDIRTATASGPIRIYVDTNVGGLAWDRWSADAGECESGAIGPDRADYEAVGYRLSNDVNSVDAYWLALCDVMTGLRAAGFDVAK